MTPQDLKAARDRGRRDFTWADLRALDLRGIDLAGVNLSRGRMEGVVAEEVNFERAILGRASLRGADLRRSRLGQAVLARADLSQACFDGANLQRADLSSAIAEGATWEGADLTGAKISWPWPSADLTGATMPDGRPYSADWQPPDPEPDLDEDDDPFGEPPGELSDSSPRPPDPPANAHADLAQHLSQAAVPKPKASRADLALQRLRQGRRHRFLTADPNFAVPGVGPQAPPPPPRSLADWGQRLERSLVIFTLLGYLLLGMALVGREAEWPLWVFGAIGCWAGLLGEGWLMMGPGMAAIAFALSMMTPVREFVFLMALLVGTSFLTWSLVFSHSGQSRGRKRQALNNGISVTSGVAGLISIVFSLTTTPLAAVAAGGAIVCLLLGLPLNPVMSDRGLTKLQQAVTLLVLAGVGFAIAQLVG